MGKARYDCSACAGYCCSVYDEVPVTRRDLVRLARSLGLGVEVARRRFTKVVRGTRVLRRRRDPVLRETCFFFDIERRCCGAYEARPAVCREWPAHGGGRCVYYELQQFERGQQGDATVVPLVKITPLPRGQGGRVR